MRGAGAKAGLLRWIARWLGGRRAAEPAAPLAEMPPAFLPPKRPPFASRREAKPAAVAVTGLGLEAQLAIGRSRALAARLRSVASENVPSSLAARKPALAGPAGKAIPKPQPRVLKSYRKAGQPPLISARLRILKLTTLRPSNVIELVTSLKAFRAAFRGRVPHEAKQAA